MKNLKFFIVLIALMFSIGTTLQAQRCFTMKVVERQDGQHHHYDITIHNLSIDGDAVSVYDDSGAYDETCTQPICNYIWSYPKPSCGTRNKEIKCETTGASCEQFDGCVVIISGDVMCNEGF